MLSLPLRNLPASLPANETIQKPIERRAASNGDHHHLKHIQPSYAMPDFSKEFHKANILVFARELGKLAAKPRESLAKVSGQGFPYEGSDRRMFGWFAPLFRWLSWESNLQPPSLILQFLGFKLYLPLPKQRFYMVRAGWHWDSTAKAYILGFAAKVTSSAQLY